MPKTNTPTRYQEKEVPFGFGPVARALSTTWGALKNVGSDIAGLLPSLPSPSGPQPTFTKGPPTPQFYQVKAEDKNLSDVAAQNNIPLSNLVEINQSKTLPPKGSYIQLYDERYDKMNQAGPTTTPATSIRDGRGDPALRNRQQQANTIMQQLASGQLPNTIPSGLLGFIHNAAGEPLTLQMAQQLGYTLNAQGVLVNGGNFAAQHAPGAEFAASQGYQANMNLPFMQQITYINGKRMKIGDAVRRGLLDLKTGRRFKSPMKRNRKGKLVSAERPEPVVPVTTVVEPSRAGPQTVLDIHLGSG